MTEIKSVHDLLNMNLVIPAYQRPYKWETQNVQDLLQDIANAIEDAEKYRWDFKYRVGTVILYPNDRGQYEVVDGQQRILSLVLLEQCLHPNFTCSILNAEFSNKITQSNLHRNYKYIADWFSFKSEEIKKQFVSALERIVEVVVIVVETVAEAFQLFDAQNTRGKALDPHDLLKAYHLRAMKECPYEMEHAVTKWEAQNTDEIRNLFDLYLFPVWNWSRGVKSKPFTAKEIDTYKGIPETSLYTYARRASNAMPYFQITELFIAGNDFFEMVDHYLNLLHDIQAEVANNPRFSVIREILDMKTGSTGFGYAKNLFYCALLCYYDKFHNFDEMAVKKLFIWAFMLRVDMENLSFDSVNKYAIGDETNDRYTNHIAMFCKIDLARLHTEISGLLIATKRENDAPASDNWKELYDTLKTMNGSQGGGK